MSLFIELAFDPATRFYYLAWVLIVIVSIVLHELAHGWMAMRHGDDTPADRMTGNPLLHMGPMSLVALGLFGIAWGAMPIDPSRMRGRYAEAKVAVAGPFTNLVIALVAMVALGLLYRFVGVPQEGWQDNGYQMLHIAGTGNLVLMLFNLIPVPPLDGSHILANFSRPYASFISDPSKHGVMFLAFAFVFAISPILWEAGGRASLYIVWFIRTVGA